MRKRRMRAQQAVSAIVSAILLVGMLLTTGFAYFAFEVRAQRMQSAALDYRFQVDQQQALERFNVMGQVSGTDTVAAYVVNNGPIPIRIAYMIVLNTSKGGDIGYNNTMAKSIYVNPGKSSPSIISNAVHDPNTQYSIGVVTARGTVVYALFPTPRGGIPGVIQEGLTSLDTGSIVIDFFSIRYSQKTGATWGPWTAGWLLPKGKNTVWAINVTNIDMTRDLYVNRYSNLYLIEAGSTLGSVIVFYIIRVQPDFPASISSLAAYSDTDRVVIPRGTWAFLYFGVDGPGDNPNVGGNLVKFTDENKQYAMFLLISGNWDSNTGEPYGQNIPFEGVRTQP